jgi:excisionase family DNA binding protein
MERLTVSVEEAAQALGVSRAHAFRMVNSGELPARRLGKRWLVSIDTLKELAGSAKTPALTA